MSFTDPQTITIGGVTTPLPRTSVLANGSLYRSADGLIKMSAQTTYGRRTRAVLRLDHSQISPSAMIAGTNVLNSMSTYIVFDTPVVGYTNAEAYAVYQGFIAQVTAGSNALITKLLGGES